MLMRHFRQAGRMARSEKLYSLLYISGVALSVAAVMVLSIIIFSRLAPIYPEYNRSRTVYLTTVSMFNKGYGMTLQGALPYPYAAEWTKDFPGMEHVSIWESGTDPVSLPGKDIIGKVLTIAADPAYFNIYSFDFLAGAPFTQADFEGANKKVVISDRLASALFGSPEGALGQEVELDFSPFTVCGVVRGASPSTQMTHYEAFYPASLEEAITSQGSLAFMVVMLMKEGFSVEDLRAEFERRVKLTELNDDKWEFKLFNQPRTHYEYTFEPTIGTESEESSSHYMGYYIIVAMVLLIVPALNLSGLIVGRMDRRSTEMGIRKGFGASRSNLLWQIFSENFIMTLAGSLLGLLIAWVAVYINSDWIFSILDSWVTVSPGSISGTVEPGSFFSPWVFLITLAATLLLNILSSVVPAWFALRRPIVESINDIR